MTAPKKISFLTQYGQLIQVTIAIIISVVGATWGAFRLFDKQADETVSLDKTLTEVVSAVKEIEQNQDSLLLIMNEFNGQLEAVHENTVRIGNYVEGVKKALDYHLKKSPEVSKEDYAKMMELIEERLEGDNVTYYGEPKIVIRKIDNNTQGGK